MPIPTISVEIAPPDSNGALRAALLDACTRAARDAECVVSAPEATPPSVIAIVSFRGAEDVRLEVALRAEQKWMTREIHFDPRDPAEERWRAVGLLIGTLASSMAPPPPGRADAAPVAKEPASPPPPPVQPPATPTTQRPPLHAPAVPEPAPSGAPPRTPARGPSAFIGVAFVLGTAMDRGPFRLGADVTAHGRLTGRVHGALGVADTQSAGSVGGVATRWTELHLGAAYDVPVSPTVSLLLGGSAFAERFSPSLVEGGPAPATGARWLAGARLDADLRFRLAGPFGVFVGATARAASAPTDVQVGGALVGTAPAPGVLGRAGVSVGLW